MQPHHKTRRKIHQNTKPTQSILQHMLKQRSTRVPTKKEAPHILPENIEDEILEKIEKIFYEYNLKQIDKIRLIAILQSFTQTEITKKYIEHYSKIGGKRKRPLE